MGNRRNKKASLKQNKIAFQSKADLPRFLAFYCHDLDLDPMTLIYELNLRTKMKFLGFRKLSRCMHCKNIHGAATRVVKNKSY